MGIDGMFTATALYFLLLASTTLGHSWRGLAERGESTRKVPQSGFFDPLNSGGSLLTQMNDGYSVDLGEPLNAIISGNSDGDVLVDDEVKGGLRNYFLSLGFSSECLGQVDPGQQGANLGDGLGWVNQTAVLRWNYDDPNLGTCRETIQGGNHFRFWVQDGPDANSGAIFMAVSYEKNFSYHHDIAPNGYNLGRDLLVGNITGSTIPTAQLTNESTYAGATSANGYTYETAIQYMSGYLQNSSLGINHNDSVSVNGSTAIDGLVALLTVKISERPSDALSSWPSGTQSMTLFSITSLLVFLLSL